MVSIAAFQRGCSRKCGSALKGSYGAPLSAEQVWKLPTPKPAGVLESRNARGFSFGAHREEGKA